MSPSHLNPAKCAVTLIATIASLTALMMGVERVFGSSSALDRSLLFVCGYVALRHSGAFFRICLRRPVRPDAFERLFDQTRASCGVRAARLVLFESEQDVAFGAGDFLRPSIFVSTALAQRLSAAALEALFAHEFGHLRYWHIEATAALLACFASLRDVVPPAGTTFALIGMLIAYLATRRQFERIADCFAARYAGRAAITELLLAIAPARRPSRWMTLLFTHPTHDQRIAELEKGSSHARSQHT
jgi:Zn-dependent protease with chaperone function